MDQVSNPVWISVRLLDTSSGDGCSDVLKDQDVPIGASLIFFSQWLGGAIFVSVGQNVLSTKLVSGFKGLG